MVQREHYATPDIKQRISQLQAKWDLLKEKALKRKHDLDDALQAQQYFTDANEVDAWIKEKEPQVSSTDYGKDEDSVEVINYISL
jgi:spectrin alpha